MEYIGITVGSITARFWEHAQSPSYLGNAIRKYGVGTFCVTLLETVESYEEACAREIALIKEYNTFCPYGYNRDTGGRAGKTASLETRLNMSRAHKGRVGSHNKYTSAEVTEMRLMSAEGHTYLDIMALFNVCHDKYVGKIVRGQVRHGE